MIDEQFISMCQNLSSIHFALNSPPSSAVQHGADNQTGIKWETESKMCYIKLFKPYFRPAAPQGELLKKILNLWEKPTQCFRGIKKIIITFNKKRNIKSIKNPTKLSASQAVLMSRSVKTEICSIKRFHHEFRTTCERSPAGSLFHQMCKNTTYSLEEIISSFINVNTSQYWANHTHLQHSNLRDR